MTKKDISVRYSIVAQWRVLKEERHQTIQKQNEKTKEKTEIPVSNAVDVDECPDPIIVGG